VSRLATLIGSKSKPIRLQKLCNVN